MKERLVAPRLKFMQIREMPRRGQLSLKGNVVNVPADVHTTVKILPRMQCDEDTILLLKFKRKTRVLKQQSGWLTTACCLEMKEYKLMRIG